MLSALVVDGALLESAATEADASAYAAAHSALMVYRESGDRVLARHSAKEALKANAVHGNHPSLEELEWGYVIGSSGLFVPDADATEAVRVTAAR